MRLSLGRQVGDDRRRGTGGLCSPHHLRSSSSLACRGRSLDMSSFLLRKGMYIAIWVVSCREPWRDYHIAPVPTSTDDLGRPPNWPPSVFLLTLAAASQSPNDPTICHPYGVCCQKGACWSCSPLVRIFHHHALPIHFWTPIELPEYWALN